MKELRGKDYWEKRWADNRPSYNPESFQVFSEFAIKLE